ncbi:uncharacterized protein M6B38_203270 [Iris pallida]|uniref:Uncharacterized protein n=1 Tax=Iris pallida TaxID=29817 RepID=A0AAX6E868_IRIPA|nr:uncharacterized protein M6B38_203270 [Iris pallida]
MAAALRPFLSLRPFNRRCSDLSLSPPHYRHSDPEPGLRDHRHRLISATTPTTSLSLSYIVATDSKDDHEAAHHERADGTDDGGITEGPTLTKGSTRRIYFIVPLLTSGISVP